MSANRKKFIVNSLANGVVVEGILNVKDNNIVNVNKVVINDPGPNEGIEWAGGNGWKIYESPDDLTTNSAGNLQFVTGCTARMRLNSSAGLDVLGSISINGTVVIDSTGAFQNINLGSLGALEATSFNSMTGFSSAAPESAGTASPGQENSAARSDHVHPPENFVFTQSVPASTWTIDHTLLKVPSVTVVDSSGNVVLGDINIVSNSRVILEFGASFSGVAYLN